MAAFSQLILSSLIIIPAISLIHKPFVKQHSINQLYANKLTNLISFTEIPFQDDDENLTGMEALTSDSKQNIMTADQLRAEWDKLVVKNKKLKKMNFYLRNILPDTYKPDSHTIITDVEKEDDSSSSTELYLTESELRRLWQESSFKTFGKPISKFNVIDSLLLIPDEDEDDIMGDDTIYEISLYEDNDMKKNKKIKFDDAIEITDPIEYIVTTEELQRVWEKRSQVTFGLPSTEYNEQAALLLLCEEQEDSDSSDSDVAGDDMEMYLDGDSYNGIEYVSGYESTVKADDETGYWNDIIINDLSNMNKQSSITTTNTDSTNTNMDTTAVNEEDEDDELVSEIKSSLREIYYDLEDLSTNQPAWQKKNPSLTPDLDTQSFLGDVMQGNSYMTQRIPANWDDPEASEMSDTYRSTSTMSMPDQPLVDYTQKQSIWEALRVNILNPDQVSIELSTIPEAQTLHTPQLISSSTSTTKETSSTGGQTTTTVKDNETPDWFTIDMAELDTLPNTFDEIDDPEMAQNKALKAPMKRDSSGSDLKTTPINEDDFYANLLGDTMNDGIAAGLSATSSTPVLSPEQLEDEYDFQDDYEEDEPVTPQMMISKLANVSTPVICRKFQTPQAWIDHPDISNHVGYDIWSRYDPIYFDDDRNTWDDLSTVLSIQHLNSVTDMYLTDHLELKHQQDMYKYWDRILYTKLMNETFQNESIPIYLTPDIDRGITYSDHIIEMKGKMVLETYLDPPAVMFANDTFTYNEELETLNKIGTIREQYDWTPTIKPEDCVIEDHILEKIQPILRFVNHAAVLKSTKNNILIFEYLSTLRHIIGVRDIVFQFAKTCYPEVVDVRMETHRKNDRSDS